MPRVPTYDEFQATPQVLGPTRADAAMTPGMASVAGQQQQQLGESMVKGGDMVAKIALDIQKDINEAATKEADNKVAESLNRLMHDPKSGFLTLQGKDAIDRRQDAQKYATDSVMKAGENLSNDMQRKMFSDVAQRRLQMAAQQIDAHAAGQARIYNETETSKRVENSLNDAANNFFGWNQDKSQYQTSKATMLAEVNAYAQLKGFAPDSETAKALRMEKTTQLHRKVIDTFTSLEKVTEAQEYFKRNYNEIEPEQRAKLEKDLNKDAAAVVASNTADDIWATKGPKGYNDPIDLALLEKTARETFPNEPLKVKATIDELRSRAAAWDKSQSEFDNSNTNAIGLALSQGKSLKAIQLMPQFKALGGAKQNEIINAVTDRNHMLWARGIEDRNRIEAEQARKNAPYLFELSDPRRLQTMTREEVAATWTKVGISNTAGLLQKWDSLQNKIEGSTIISSEDLIKDSATKMTILPANGKPNDDQKLAFIEYRRDFAERVANFEATELQGRRKASPNELKKIVTDMELDKVYKPRSLLSDKEVPLSTIKADDLSTAYVVVNEPIAPGAAQTKPVKVRVAEVPKGQRKNIIDALRAAGEPRTEKNIVQWWVDHGRRQDD